MKSYVISLFSYGTITIKTDSFRNRQKNQQISLYRTRDDQKETNLNNKESFFLAKHHSKCVTEFFPFIELNIQPTKNSKIWLM